MDLGEEKSLQQIHKIIFFGRESKVPDKLAITFTNYFPSPARLLELELSKDDQVLGQKYLSFAQREVAVGKKFSGS